MSTLFISDLHLSQEQPEITELFLTFLQHHAVNAEALYILGDLFEVWLGDDMILPDYQSSILQIRALVDSGTPVYIMYGNRDFLMRKQFEKLSGAQLIYEPYLIDLAGTKTLLLHGDTLCTDDVEYQKFRTMVRNPKWQDEMLSKPPDERLALAKKFREISKTATAQKENDIMDVNQDAVLQAMRENKVTNLIHGHTHRPDTHNFMIDDNKATRTVLADWGKTGSYLQVDESGYHMHNVE